MFADDWGEPIFGTPPAWALEHGEPLGAGMSIFFGDDDREEVEIRPLTDMSTWVGDYTAHLSMAHGLRGKGKSLFVNVFGHKLKFDSWTYRGRSPNPMPGSVSISPYGEIKVHTEPNTPNTCLLYTSPSPRD